MSTIKVFKLDDYEWWAGESLLACIAAAREQCGADCYENAETEGQELGDVAMRKLKILRDPENPKDRAVTFKYHLAELVACKSQTFPVLFAATEW